MDTEEDPTGKFDMIFERLRDDVDESGRSGMTHASFGALIAGVQPAIPPPWENVNGTLDELVNQRFGSMLGQSRDSAGVVEYLTLPRLVRGLAQVSEIAAGDGACSTIMTVHNTVACMPIYKFGTDEQKERFLRPLARGEWLGGFALTEPEAGSDAAALRTRVQNGVRAHASRGGAPFDPRIEGITTSYST